MTLLCEALHAPRSSVYAPEAEPAPTDGGKRGPKTKLDDDALVEAIRAVLAACPFHSEGHRKVMRGCGLGTSTWGASACCG